MDVMAFLKIRTAFIRQFYSNSAESFLERIRLIEGAIPPFEPPYSEDGEPPLMEEWSEAQESLDLLGATCVSMLSETLKLYFQTWEQKLRLSCQVENKAVFKKRGFVAGYLVCFGKKLESDWSDCPADLELLEQIAHARNDAQHHKDITSLRLYHNPKVQERHASPFFLSDAERRMIGEEDYREMPWSRGLTLTVSREALLEAINQVEIFADWIERTE